MTSKLVVNTIEADTGISSVSFASSISMDSTSKFHFSAAGVDIGADTNINRPSAGVLGFNINGSQKVVITSNGRLGIGTNNPQQMIEVQDRSGGTLIGLSVGTQYGNAGFGGYNNYPAIMNSSSQPLIYCDTNNDRTVFFGDTVGFGTTCAFRVNSAERLRIDSSGRLLIGTTSTNQNISKIVVKASSPSDNYDNHIYLEGSETSGDANTGGVLGFGGHDGGGSFRNWANIWGVKENSTDGNTASYMAFHTRPNGGNPTERLRIGSSGQIGVAGANYGTARETIVSGGASAAVSWSANPFVIDMAGLGDVDYGKMFVRYRETATVTGNGLIYLGICKSTTNCPAGRAGTPIGFIPSTVYNGHFRVDKVGVTPWPDSSGHRYEYYAIISDYVSSGKLGVFYLTNTTS